MNEILTEPNVKIIPKPNSNFREGVVKFEQELRNRGGIIGDSPEYLKICKLTHKFADGCYIRELFMPKGLLFVTKIHKITHPYFLMKGDCSILTEEGPKRIKGPFSGITLAGTKRVIYTHEDTVWITVHVTEETDLAKIEEQVIAKTYNEVPNLTIDVEAEEIKITNFIEELKKGEVDEKTLGDTIV